MPRGNFLNGNRGLFKNGEDRRRTGGFKVGHKSYRKPAISKEERLKRQRMIRNTEEYRNKQREKRKTSEWQEKWGKNYYNKPKVRNNRRNNQLKRYFGITLEEYNTLFIKQSGLCAICFKSETIKQFGKIKPLSVDHCHKTNKIRGLLCSSCNVGLGHFKDDILLLGSAKKYLIENNGN